MKFKMNPKKTMPPPVEILPDKPKPPADHSAIIVKSIVGLGIFISFSAMLFSFIDGGGCHSSGADEEDTSIPVEVIIAAKKVICKHLNCPATAEFPELKDHIKNLGGGEFLVDTPVDAQNLFGAKAREYFRFKINFNEKESTYTYHELTTRRN